VLDVGGGKDCPFFPYLNQPRGQLIIGLDYSEDQLRENRDINQKIVADAMAPGLPLRERSADLVVSRSVVSISATIRHFLRTAQMYFAREAL
jgi:ubiquinone/menaquinone biosynthesis C-methylase UbiE